MITLHGQLDWIRNLPGDNLWMYLCVLFPERRGGVTECGHQTTEEERGERELHFPAS